MSGSGSGRGRGARRERGREAHAVSDEISRSGTHGDAGPEPITPDGAVSVRTADFAFPFAHHRGNASGRRDGDLQLQDIRDRRNNRTHSAGSGLVFCGVPGRDREHGLQHECTYAQDDGDGDGDGDGLHFRSNGEVGVGVGVGGGDAPAVGCGHGNACGYGCRWVHDGRYDCYDGPEADGAARESLEAFALSEAPDSGPHPNRSPNRNRNRNRGAELARALAHCPTANPRCLGFSSEEEDE